MVTYGCLTKLLINMQTFESLARSTRLTPGPKPGSGYATAATLIASIFTWWLVDAKEKYPMHLIFDLILIVVDNEAVRRTKKSV